MKVLLVTWEYPPNGAGIGGYVRQMGEALAACGHRAVILTGRVPGLPEKQETPAGLVLRQYDVPDVGAESFADQALAVAREHGVDWIEGADHWGELACLLRRSHPIPVVIKAHSSNVLRVMWESQILHEWQRPLIHLARLKVRKRISDEATCLSKADALVAPSRRILDELARQGTPLPAHHAVVPNPISAPGGEKAGSESPDPTLLLAGRIDIGKGIQYLPELLERLSPRFPGLRLEIAGPDTHARGLGSMQGWLTKRLGSLTSRVRFHGRLTAESLAEAYDRAWVVIVPSRWDNFPTVVLEAMVRGRPIVASPNGGMPEMLQGTACPIVDPSRGEAFADAVAGLLSSAERRREAGASAKTRSLKEYSPEAVVPRYVNFIRSCL